MPVRQYKHILTIAIPCYNDGDFIDQSLQSVLAVDIDNLDIVVIDNNSSDDSLERVRSYNDKRLRIIENSINYGIGYSGYLIHCDSESKYISFIGADDIWADENLHSRLAFMDQHREITLFAGATKGFIEAPEKHQKPYLADCEPHKIITTMPLSCWGALIRTEFFDLTDIVSNPFNRHNNDYEWLAKAIFAQPQYPFQIHSDDQVVAYIRQRENSITQNAQKNHFLHDLIVYEYMFNKLGIQPTQKELIAHHILRFPSLTKQFKVTYDNLLNWCEKLISTDQKKLYFDPIKFDSHIIQKLALLHQQMGLSKFKLANKLYRLN
ncbi:MAG: glycosyltransferase [Pseudomonadota bacterium]